MKKFVKQILMFISVGIAGILAISGCSLDVGKLSQDVIENVDEIIFDDTIYTPLEELESISKISP